MIPAWLSRLLGLEPKRTCKVLPQPPRLLISQQALDALVPALARSHQMQHEGVAFLLGRTDGTVTIVVGVFAPEARTTAGSFFVPPRAVAACVQAAAELDLQIAGQIHTHPRGAGHTDGDEDGAKIRYPGFASIVVPDYGRHLPSLKGAATYLWQKQEEWVQLDHESVVIIPGAGPWTKTSLPLR